MPGVAQRTLAHPTSAVGVTDKKTGICAGYRGQVDQQVRIVGTGLSTRFQNQQERRQPAFDDQRLVIVDHGLFEIAGETGGGPVDQRAAAAQQQGCRNNQQSDACGANRGGRRADTHGDKTTRPPASAVFCISVATVIGPTPPGTGVIQDARRLAASKSRSPRTRPSGSRCMPISTATVPGCIHSESTTPGLPTATNR